MTGTGPTYSLALLREALPLSTGDAETASSAVKATARARQLERAETSPTPAAKGRRRA